MSTHEGRSILPAGRTSVAGIESRGLGHRYGDFLAVSDVSFAVEAGEVFGLLGPNGAGKTTILRMLAGILRPSQGQALLMGVDVHSDPLDAKRCFGFLSGETKLYARLTVRECLEYFSTLFGLDRAATKDRVATVSEAFGLAEFIDLRCGSLSTGQLQRANLARAFVGDPPVLILDEPTTGLDVISGRFVLDAVQRAKDAGRAVLFSTHVMSEVEELCDRVGLLLRGRLVDMGAHDELLAKHEARTMGALLTHLDAESPEIR
ncbi:MAG: ATP-binding cassette domain-containing protein [Deltaproteobacteria bacterium]|nr:ATP-binding cassette domain-containing protein [Deltaproteobacteria bacterium]